MGLERLTENHEIDTRALAAFRISLGVLLIVDILLRSRNFWRYYTDDGIFESSRVTALFWETGNGYLPVWGFLPDPEAVVVVFVLAFLAGVLLVVGYKTKYVTPIAFVLVVLIDGRNLLVLSMADTFYRLMLFWGIFLPLGARWSIDATRGGHSFSRSASVVSVWSFAALFQICWMYLRNAQAKLRPQYWVDTDLVPVLMTYDHVTYSHTELIAGLPVWPAVTWVWLIMMAVSPVLFFLRGWQRALGAAAYIGVHLTMAATLRIGAFPYAVATALLLFLPPLIWTRVEAVVDSTVPARFHSALVSLGRTVNQVGRPLEPSQQTIRRLKATAIAVALAVAAIGLAGLVVFSGVYIADSSVAESTPADDPVDAVMTTSSVVGVEQPPFRFYSADPPYPNPYYVVAAESEAGKKYDVYNDRRLNFSRPYENQNIHHQYDDSYRERFVMTTIRRNEGFADGFLDYYCDYSLPDGTAVESMSLYAVTEDVTASTRFNRDARDREIEHIETHGCGDREPEQVGDPPEDG